MIRKTAVAKAEFVASPIQISMKYSRIYYIADEKQ